MTILAGEGSTDNKDSGWGSSQKSLNNFGLEEVVEVVGNVFNFDTTTISSFQSSNGFWKP